MASAGTPSGIMYATLKGWKVSNKDAAKLLLSDTQKHGEQYLIDRIEERTFLFRLTHAEPGAFPESYFTDLTGAAQMLCSRVVKGDPSVGSMAVLVERLSGQAASDMAAACREASLDWALFSNLVAKVGAHPGLTDADRASAMMLAFVAVGCLGSPARATDLVEGFLRDNAARGFRTELAAEGAYAAEPVSAETRLGLVRVIDGGLDLNSMHELDIGPAGTIIGSMATEPGSINDVGPLVSKRHARVFRDADGGWWVEGLGSTNGTVLIRGDDKREVLVEAPRSERKGAPAAEPVPLQPGDALHLAGTTVFLTMKLA